MFKICASTERVKFDRSFQNEDENAPEFACGICDIFCRESLKLSKNPIVLISKFMRAVRDKFGFEMQVLRSARNDESFYRILSQNASEFTRVRRLPTCLQFLISPIFIRGKPWNFDLKFQGGAAEVLLKFTRDIREFFYFEFKDTFKIMRGVRERIYSGIQNLFKFMHKDRADFGFKFQSDVARILLKFSRSGCKNFGRKAQILAITATWSRQKLCEKFYLHTQKLFQKNFRNDRVIFDYKLQNADKNLLDFTRDIRKNRYFFYQILPQNASKYAQKIPQINREDS